MASIIGAFQGDRVQAIGNVVTSESIIDLIEMKKQPFFSPELYLRIHERFNSFKVFALKKGKIIPITSKPKTPSFWSRRKVASGVPLQTVMPLKGPVPETKHVANISLQNKESLMRKSRRRVEQHEVLSMSCQPQRISCTPAGNTIPLVFQFPSCLTLQRLWSARAVTRRRFIRSIDGVPEWRCMAILTCVINPVPSAADGCCNNECKSTFVAHVAWKKC